MSVKQGKMILLEIKNRIIEETLLHRFNRCGRASLNIETFFCAV